MILSIIIPSKNEERYIQGVITSIKNSDIKFTYEIIVSDKSTDNTRQVITELDKTIKIIEGGPVGVARNNGALEAKGQYLLFLDADIIFTDKELINKSIVKLIQGNDMVTTKLKCSNNNIVSLIYWFNNIFQYLSIIDKKPFSTGSFMAIRKEEFVRLGGFNLEALHCEDYLLSMQIKPNKFKIVNSFIYTDDRRFKKMGYIGMIKYFLYNIINRKNKNFFYTDVNYWK